MGTKFLGRLLRWVSRWTKKHFETKRCALETDQSAAKVVGGTASTPEQPLNPATDAGGKKLMTPEIAFILNRTVFYKAYYQWEGNADIRGYKMHIARKDWELAGALYRIRRRQEYIRKAMNDIWGTNRAS